MSVTRITTEDWLLWRELRLRALEDAPYAFSSSLSEWQGAGDQEERWRARLDSVGFNAIAYAQVRPAGMVSGVRGEGRVELISMWVAPFARGTGLGDELIDAVVRWALGQGVAAIELSVKQNNQHAIELYRRNGFVDVGADEHEGQPGETERRMRRA
jgi:ribosomal protein S18 acetylase RimI-like enzyme